MLSPSLAFHMRPQSEEGTYRDVCAVPRDAETILSPLSTPEELKVCLIDSIEEMGSTP